MFVAPTHNKINKNMSSIINFDYKGSEISFMSGGNVIVNATQMAKPFGKPPKDFLKTEQTKAYASQVVRIILPTLPE